MIALEKAYSDEWSGPVWALMCQGVVFMAWIDSPFVPSNGIDCDHSDFKTVFDGTADFEPVFMEQGMFEEYLSDPDVSRTLDWNYRLKKSLFNGSN